MVLAFAAFATLPLPSWCDVPAGALNHTGVISKRNELLLRSRATISLGAHLKNLEEDGRIIDRELNSEVDKAGCLLTYPRVTGGADESGLTYLPPPHLTALAYLSRNKTKTLPARAAAARASAAAA